MNQKNRCLLFFMMVASALLVIGCANRNKTTNNTTDKPDKNWISLFNGTDLNDWIVKIHHHDVGNNYGNTFRVEDGIIKVRYDQYDSFNEQFGHLYYKTPFSDY